MDDSTDTQPVLEARDIVQEFALRAGPYPAGVVRAVDGVSFQLRPRETLAIIGESGSGKSTLARALLQIPPAKSGAVLFRGCDITRLPRGRLLEYRRQIQIIFQDPFRSLNPKWRVKEIVAEPLVACGSPARARRRKVEEILERVGLASTKYGARRPAELSGGQCQRVAIARALAAGPAVVICDEAVSSLDVLIQAQVLSLFEELRNDLNLSYLFISHDLAIVKRISDRVLVLNRGEVCEHGETARVFADPAHPYTAALVQCARMEGPTNRPPLFRASEVNPDTREDARGCRFRSFCARAQQRCAGEKPPLRRIAADHWAACHFDVPVAAAVLERTGTAH